MFTFDYIFNQLLLIYKNTIDTNQLSNLFQEKILALSQLNKVTIKEHNTPVKYIINLGLINRIIQFTNKKHINHEELGNFSSLPSEIIYLIIDKLSYEDTISLSLTNYSFFLLVNIYKINKFIRLRKEFVFQDLAIDKLIIKYKLFLNNNQESELKLYQDLINFLPKYNQISEISLFLYLHKLLQNEYIDNTVLLGI